MPRGRKKATAGDAASLVDGSAPNEEKKPVSRRGRVTNNNQVVKSRLKLIIDMLKQTEDDNTLRHCCQIAVRHLEEVMPLL